MISCTEICGTGRPISSRMNTSRHIFTGMRKGYSGVMGSHPSACFMSLGLRMRSGMFRYACNNIGCVIADSACHFTSRRSRRVVALYASSCTLIKPSYPVLAPPRDTQWSRDVQIFLLLFAIGMVSVVDALLDGYQLCASWSQFDL
jgi:hypothetical protein